MNLRATFGASARVRGLYGITPEWDDTARLLAAAGAAARGGMRVLQLRRKQATPAKKREQALALRELCARLGLTFIVNDDWRLALDVSADGVHLGREDGDIAAVRRQIGLGLLLGASCYDDPARARAAIEAGADHVAFGAVFASPTKPAAARAPLNCLTEACALQRPVVAIGGITPANASQAVAAGADAIAVITALFGADGIDDIEATAREFSKAFPNP